jgi:hypothetical protein
LIGDIGLFKAQNLKLRQKVQEAQVVACDLHRGTSDSYKVLGRVLLNELRVGISEKTGLSRMVVRAMESPLMYEDCGCVRIGPSAPLLPWEPH